MVVENKFALIKSNINNIATNDQCETLLKVSKVLVRVCFNLLVNSAPWVSAARGTGRVSKEKGRGAEVAQPSQGGGIR